MPTNSRNLLPSTLIASNDYVALTDVQRDNFLARLYYCEEIAEKASDAANTSDSDLFDVIDDIELDALSIMSGFSNPDTLVSPYIVHSSWTFEADCQVMAQYVESDIAKFLGASPIGLGASNNEIRAWLQGWSQTLNLSLSRLAGSSSFTEAVVHLILIDAIVSSYLVSAAIIRLMGR